MPMTSAGLKILLVVVICPVILLTMACEYRDKYSGTYRSESRGLQAQDDVILDLKPKGEGLWRAGNDEVPFSWYIKGGELRVNTRAGGVITGVVKGETIQITLPGAMKMTFRKVP